MLAFRPFGRRLRITELPLDSRAIVFVAGQFGGPFVFGDRVNGPLATTFVEKPRDRITLWRILLSTAEHGPLSRTGLG